jgi:Na+-transporting methylmalonyl-CoA/oxaloacetate decarboxylase beta subunit
MNPKVIWRVAPVLLMDSVTLLGLSALIDGFVLKGVGSALGAAAMIGVFNALVWSALSVSNPMSATWIASCPASNPPTCRAFAKSG